MEQIFRVGDTVYHWEYGKGTVNEIDLSEQYAVTVQFERDPEAYMFTINGSEYINGNPTLSHTPYDLVNGGFFQREPLPDIKKGTPVFVKNKRDVKWRVRVFSHFDNGGIHVFDNGYTDALTVMYDEYALENPTEYKD